MRGGKIAANHRASKARHGGSSPPRLAKYCHCRECIEHHEVLKVVFGITYPEVEEERAWLSGRAPAFQADKTGSTPVARSKI
jgi:hypothetical protein